METSPNILLIDNFDSFTYNLFHLLKQLNVKVDVIRNNVLDVSVLSSFDGIVVGPGPGLPSEAGGLPTCLEACFGKVPMLGVCLGMQAALEQAGATMVNLAEVHHGSQSLLTQHENNLLFRELPKQFVVGRYHSWGFLPEAIPEGFVVTGTSEDGYVMAVESQANKFCGVQFHPESIMTKHGLAMLQNWIDGVVNQDK